MNLEIKITGSGRPHEIAKALRQLADDIQIGLQNNSIKTKGKCEWEDSILMTQITEGGEID